MYFRKFVAARRKSAHAASTFFWDIPTHSLLATEPTTCIEHICLGCSNVFVLVMEHGNTCPTLTANIWTGALLQCLLPCNPLELHQTLEFIQQT